MGKASRLVLAALGYMLSAAGIASAQVPNWPQTLPPDTIVGRLNIGSGPAQAIPFSALFSNLPAPSASTLGGIESLTCASHQWLNTISTAGIPACGQPGFSDLSGALATSQLPGLASADIWVGNGSGVAAAVAVSGDCTLSNAGALICTKTNGTAFAPSATTDTTNASNISAGTLAGARMAAVNLAGSGNGGVTGNLPYNQISGVPTASNSALGVAQCDGTTTTCASGVITATEAAAGGFINKFRNGTFDVWQRGTSSLATSTSGAYTADGWIVKQTGAAFTCQRNGTGDEGTLYGLICVGGASNTDTLFSQRIESYIAAPLAGKTVTVQFPFYQTSGSSVTPKVSGCYASAQDNFSTCTSDLTATSLTSCATATWCVEAYTFNVSASATTGYQVTLDCNTALTSAQYCMITAADIRVTPGVATGINANPPPPELRPIGVELAFSQRYLQTWSGLDTMLPISMAPTASLGYCVLMFALPMRAAPTMSASGSGIISFSTASAGNLATTAIAFTNISVVSALIEGTISGATAGQAMMPFINTSSGLITASAEL